jgi:ubiquinone/menaquinone biosynthesis C-methylase UbiE
VIFWQIYALVYDHIMLHLLPYRRLLDAAAKSLNPKSGWHILDAGCGTGNFLHHLLRLEPKVKADGIDFAPAMLQRAGLKSKKIVNWEHRVTLREADLNSFIPYGDEVFQGAACINVLYAVKRPDLLLKEIHRVLEIGGKLVLVTPPFQPKIFPVFIEHVQQMKEGKPYYWPFFLSGQILCLAPWLFIFIILNMFIKKQESFHFLKREELISLVEECGFELLSLEKVYGDQDWFLDAVKPAPEEKDEGLFFK